jgi:phosphatidate cytidylyltransferase
MSPRAALESNIFLIYVALVGGLLLLAGAALIVLRWRLGSRADHAWKSYRAWLFMTPAVLVAVFLGREATIVFLIALALRGFWEFARATGLVRDRALLAVVIAGILALGVVALMSDPFREAPGWYGMYMALPVYVISAILLVPILRNRSRGQLQPMSLAVLGFIYIGWMFGHLAFLANSRDAYGYILFLIFAVELNDIVAYICGRLWGKHPLRSEISPKKTWEGAIGAFAVSLAVPWLMWFSFPHFGTFELVLTGVIVGVGGQVGDLSISVIKRDVAIKDMGKMIPGHGGVLDRIDSLIYVSPLFFHMVYYFHGLY